MSALEVKVNRIEVLVDGQIQVQLIKQIVDNGVVLGIPEKSPYHRFVLSPVTNVPATISAVNNHLAQLGFNSITDNDVARINRVCEAEHTPLAVAAFRISCTIQELQNTSALSQRIALESSLILEKQDLAALQV